MTTPSDALLSAESVTKAMSERARQRRQEVLKLKREHKYTYRELAERLGVSRQRAQVLCKKAISDQKTAGR